MKSPSKQRPCHRGREGRVQHRHRLSDRSRSTAAGPEKEAAWTPSSRPARRGMGRQSSPASACAAIRSAELVMGLVRTRSPAKEYRSALRRPSNDFSAARFLLALRQVASATPRSSSIDRQSSIMRHPRGTPSSSCQWFGRDRPAAPTPSRLGRSGGPRRPAQRPDLATPLAFPAVFYFASHVTCLLL